MNILQASNYRTCGEVASSLPPRPAHIL